MTRLRIFLSIWLLVFLLSFGHGFALSTFDVFQASTLNQVIQRNKLIVGMEVEFFPFEYSNEKGEPIGFDVEIAKLAAKEMGVELDIKDIEWTGLIPALQSGKIDMIISGMTATLERAKAVTFSKPYFETGLCVLLSKKKAPGIKEIEQLNSPERIIAVKVGTTGDLITGRLFPQAQINRYKDETACVREVVMGRADAFFYDQLSIAKHHRQNPEATYAILKPFTYEPYAIAIRKGDADFLNWINMFIDTIKRDGRYRQLYDKYFSEVLGRQ